MSQRYTLTLRPRPESKRLLERLQASAEKRLGYKPSLSEVFDGLCASVDENLAIGRTSPDVQAPGHRGLPGHRPGP